MAFEDGLLPFGGQKWQVLMILVITLKTGKYLPAAALLKQAHGTLEYFYFLNYF